MRSAALTILAMGLLMVAPLTAQSLVDWGTSPSPGSQSSRNLVRDANGILYCLTIGEDAIGDRPVKVFLSRDDGGTWFDSGIVVNDASSGLSGTNQTNHCGMAIDDQGRLHITWASQYYPSFWQQYYRSYEPGTGTLSPIADLTSQVGSPTARTAAMDIEVGPSNYVWIVAHGTSSWVEKLVQSATPYAATQTFVDRGAISPSASAQTSRITIDAFGLVHLTYYRNTGSGVYEHRIYDPVNGWQAPTIIGNTTASRDLYGRLAADSLGNVHALYVKDSDSGSVWEYEYNIWDFTNGWSATPVTLMALTPAQYSGITSYRNYDLACDEGTGDVYVVYRDLEFGGGALRLALKPFGSPTFLPLTSITTATTDPYAFRFPLMRGSLFPAFDNTGMTLDLTYQTRPIHGTTPYSLTFDGNLLGDGPGVNLSLPSPVTTGSLNPVDVYAPFEPGNGFVVAFSELTDPGLFLPDGRMVRLDPTGVLFNLSLTIGNPIFFSNFGVLDAGGAATCNILVPPVPSLVGFTFYGVAVTDGPLYPSGLRSISKPLTITVN